MSTRAAPQRLHLIKVAVGCDGPDDLAARQARLLAREGVLQHRTRQCPRRQDELLAGGSLYWVIRGQIAVRQRLLGIEVVPAAAVDDRTTLLLLDPSLVYTEVKAQRPFQGWRYLSPEAAPADLEAFGADRQGDESGAMPSALRAELRALGLL